MPSTYPASSVKALRETENIDRNSGLASPFFISSLTVFQHSFFYLFMSFQHRLYLCDISCRLKITRKLYHGVMVFTVNSRWRWLHPVGNTVDVMKKLKLQSPEFWIRLEVDQTRTLIFS